MKAEFDFVLMDRPRGSRWWWYPETETPVRATPVGPEWIGPGGAVCGELKTEPTGPTIMKRIGFRRWARLKIKTRGRENELYALKRSLKKINRKAAS